MAEHGMENQSQQPSGSNECHNQPQDGLHQNSFLRSLIPSRDVGLIIGKAGKNVQEIREQTDARIRVSEVVPGASERLLTVLGSRASIARAYGMILGRILEDAQNHPSSSYKGWSPAPGSIAIRLLIPHSQVGAVIGKGGVKIREIQTATNTRIVASEQMLVNSTDRSVQILGTPENIQAAIQLILDVLESVYGDDKPSGHIPFKPTAQKLPYRQKYDEYSTPTTYDHQLQFNANSDLSKDSSGAQTVQSEQIYVAADVVGAIIGRGGSKINDIRRKSGSQIRIANAAPESSERLVTITGTIEGNQRALLLVYSCIDSEAKRKESLTANEQQVV